MEKCGQIFFPITFNVLHLFDRQIKDEYNIDRNSTMSYVNDKTDIDEWTKIT